MTVHGWLDESFCEHQNDEEDCEEKCRTCNHPCSSHTDGVCETSVNAYFYGDGECSCENFS